MAVELKRAWVGKGKRWKGDEMGRKGCCLQFVFSFCEGELGLAGLVVRCLVVSRGLQVTTLTASCGVWGLVFRVETKRCDESVACHLQLCFDYRVQYHDEYALDVWLGLGHNAKVYSVIGCKIVETMTPQTSGKISGGNVNMM
jgi:hypothetical protein